MLCIRCQKQETCDPTHICGFCQFNSTMTYWQGNHDKEEVKGMEVGALEQSKVDFIEQRQLEL